MVCGLSPGESRVRTIGPALAKALLPEGMPERSAGRPVFSQKRVSARDSLGRWLCSRIAATALRRTFSTRDLAVSPLHPELPRRRGADPSSLVNIGEQPVGPVHVNFQRVEGSRRGTGSVVQ